jgi:hypothetical protein
MMKLRNAHARLLLLVASLALVGSALAVGHPAAAVGACKIVHGVTTYYNNAQHSQQVGSYVDPECCGTICTGSGTVTAFYSVFPSHSDCSDIACD